MIDITKKPRIIQAINDIMNCGENAIVEIRNGTITVVSEKKKTRVVLRETTEK